MKSTIKEETVKVEIKIEDNLDNAFLSENEHPLGESIDSMVDEQVNANFKIEDNLDNAFLSENEHPLGESIDSMVDEQVNANFKCKEEIDNEGLFENSNEFITENQQNIEEFSEKLEVDEINISETIIQLSHYKFEHETKNDSENQKAFTQRDSPDDHKEKICRSTMSSNSIHAKNCQFCNAFFTTKRSLDDHLLKHHKQEIKGDLKSLITSQIYTCNICNSYETTEKTYIDQHLNSVHNKVKIKMKCQFCTKSFMRKQSLDGHVLFKHKDKIKNNVKSFITTKIHVCQICNSYETTHKCQLERHINLIHKKMKCQFCTTSFISKQVLDGHVLNKHKDNIKKNDESFITSKIYVCEICNSYETTHKWHLDQHINSLHNEAKNKIECQFCTKSFMRKHTLDGHILYKHKDKIKNNIKSFITSKIHVCQICNSYETTVKSSLDQHINLLHNKVNIKMKCEFCTKSFISKRSLDGHVLNKHKDKIEKNFKTFITSKIHICQICNSYETTSKSHLKYHINSVHNDAKVKFECEFCTKSFMRKQTLDGHVLNKHKDKIKNNVKSFITSKIHICQICNSYETTSKYQLERHINLIHNEIYQNGY